jgi:hypothetical protein
MASERECQSANHDRGVPDFGEPVLFDCALCGRAFCADCEGSDDDEPDACDECWALKHEAAAKAGRDAKRTKARRKRDA